jgi:hypothetical protein
MTMTSGGVIYCSYFSPLRRYSIMIYRISVPKGSYRNPELSTGTSRTTVASRENTVALSTLAS